MEKRLLFAAAFAAALSAHADTIVESPRELPLEAALRRPGVMGHAAKSVNELAPGGGYKILPEVREGLCELNLARALLACGDPNGLARSVFDAYAEDPRGIWALHARRVMERRGR